MAAGTKESRESPRAPIAGADPRMAPLILSLRSGGVTDPAVLTALEKIPRDLFVPELFKARALEDSALPIACGQTISQPLIVGLMTQALSLESRHRVLEIGTGSGYQTSVLARLARYVYSVERYRTLLGEAETRLKSLGYQNVITRFGDGGEGWPDQAPFDRIIVTAAAPGEPTALLAQLKPKGVLVAPVGRGAVQSLQRYVGDGKGCFDIQVLQDVRFVPLLPGVAKESDAV
ncbi:protein-L-isoaspartate(D-aspartate) O-methyltransferase [soil metagenome]